MWSGAPMHDYERLDVWRDAHRLARDIYEHSRTFPSEERYGLTAQIRRAAVSIAANIAEGAGRRTQADFRRFLHISAGSANETEYYTLLVSELGWITPHQRDDLRQQVRKIRRQLVGLSTSLTDT